MKNKFLLILVGVAAMLASCNKEQTGGVDTTPKAKSFTVNVDNGLKGRAVVADLTRYVMELYKGTKAEGEPVFHKEQATGNFDNIVLDNDADYVALFWADYGTPNGTDNEYDVKSLLSAKVAKQATKVAFAGVSAFNVNAIADKDFVAVELKHGVAMVNFEQTEAFTVATNKLVVSYPESYSLNVETAEATKIEGAVSHTFAYDKKDAGTIGTSYIIASGTAVKTIMNVTATLNGEVAKTISNVPFQYNYRTNIKGAYSVYYGGTMTVTCDDEFGGNEDVNIPGGGSVESIEITRTNPYWYPGWDAASVGETIDLKAEIVKVLPVGATEELLWTISDNSRFSMGKGVITVLSPLTHSDASSFYEQTITIQTVDGRVKKSFILLINV